MVQEKKQFSKVKKEQSHERFLASMRCEAKAEEKGGRGRMREVEMTRKSRRQARNVRQRG